MSHSPSLLYANDVKCFKCTLLQSDLSLSVCTMHFPSCLPEFGEETSVCVSLPCLDVNVHGVTLPRCERVRICSKKSVCMDSNEKYSIETSCIQTHAIKPQAFTAYTFMKERKTRSSSVNPHHNSVLYTC